MITCRPDNLIILEGKKQGNINNKTVNTIAISGTLLFQINSVVHNGIMSTNYD